MSVEQWVILTLAGAGVAAAFMLVALLICLADDYSNALSWGLSVFFGYLACAVFAWGIFVIINVLRGEIP
jgi:hypothetical protein